MFNLKIFQKQTAVDKLIAFIKAGGPEENQYDELTDLWNKINLDEEGNISAAVTKEKLANLFGDDFLNQTLQGFGYRKPHGYAGDFEIIDYIYQQKINENEKFQKWDKYFHSQDAVKAVRNRKAYFIELVKEKCLSINKPLRILNIASGPCRDVLELLEKVPTEKLKIHCVEMDPKAIEYAKNLLGRFFGSVEITQKNIFKFNTDEKYDLIWSAGLFDYFHNDDFVQLLQKIHLWCAPSGEIVIGNFSISNPSRCYMEKAGDWYLFHRTDKELKELALKAGFKNEQIEVKSETLGVNLFLHISCKASDNLNYIHNKNDIPSLKHHGEYIREVKKLLPREALSPDPHKLIYLFGYFIILFFAYLLFHFRNNLIYYFLLTILVTHCLSCIGFLSHELSHNSIIRNKKYRYILEVVSWGINLIPATLWNRVHNHTHHIQTNTINDPDRQYFTSEKTAGTNLYTKIFYPNKKSLKWNPVVAFHFIPYIFRNIISSFYSKNSKPAIVPFKPKYSSKQRAKIVVELVVIILFQITIFNLVGRNLLAYFFASPLSYLFTSAVFNTYIFTNHFLNPIHEHSDPLLGTTTVEVPALLNKLHFNFSYHTEHHLFPSMNSKFYPELSKILQTKYPDRYHYLTIKDAWKKLWMNDDFINRENDKDETLEIK